jgi:hypothetical protein
MAHPYTYITLHHCVVDINTNWCEEGTIWNTSLEIRRHVLSRPVLEVGEYIVFAAPTTSHFGYGQSHLG